MANDCQKVNFYLSSAFHLNKNHDLNVIVTILYDNEVVLNLPFLSRGHSDFGIYWINGVMRKDELGEIKALLKVCIVYAIHLIISLG